MARWSRLRQSLKHTLVGLAALAACVAIARLLTDQLASLTGLGGPAASGLRRLGVIASLVLGYWAVVRFHERRVASELRPNPYVCVGALLGGAAMISATILPLFAAGAYRVVGVRDPGPSLLVALGILAAAAIEEFVFRGVLFRALERSAGSVAALLMISIAFGTLHLFNDGAGVMTFLSVSLLGMLWTAIFVLTRNLWACTLHHAAWNFAIFSTGLPLSGLEAWRELAPLESVSRGHPLVTGGRFGPEDSILNVLVLSVAVAALLRVLSRRGLLERGGPDGGAS